VLRRCQGGGCRFGRPRGGPFNRGGGRPRPIVHPMGAAVIFGPKTHAFAADPDGARSSGTPPPRPLRGPPEVTETGEGEQPIMTKSSRLPHKSPKALTSPLSSKSGKAAFTTGGDHQLGP